MKANIILFSLPPSFLSSPSLSALPPPPPLFKLLQFRPVISPSRPHLRKVLKLFICFNKIVFCMQTIYPVYILHHYTIPIFILYFTFLIKTFFLSIHDICRKKSISHFYINTRCYDIRTHESVLVKYYNPTNIFPELKIFATLQTICFYFSNSTFMKISQVLQSRHGMSCSFVYKSRFYIKINLSPVKWLCWQSLFTALTNVIRRHMQKKKVQFHAWISVMESIARIKCS